LFTKAYLRLVGTDQAQRWDSSRHFFAAAAEALRRILVENARRKRCRKHGGGRVRQDLDQVQLAAPGDGEDLLAPGGRVPGRLPRRPGRGRWP
jgi:hypothetical protein